MVYFQIQDIGYGQVRGALALAAFFVANFQDLIAKEGALECKASALSTELIAHLQVYSTLTLGLE